MSYIGNQPFNTAYVTDQFSGNGTTTSFTMSVAPASASSIIVAIYGVLQDPSTYGVVGKALNFSAAPPTGTGNISVRYLGLPASNVTTTAYRTVTDITATAGQTTFASASYTPGFIDVYRNGAKLGTADYTATNGSTVVLNNSAAAGDLIQTVSFYVSSVLNAIPAIAGSISAAYLDTTGGSGSGALVVPTGTTAQRPASSNEGMLRKNSTTGYVEYYDPPGTSWKNILTVPQLYNFGGTIQFTTCGQTGAFGPILSDAQTSYAAQPYQGTWLTNSNYFNVIAGVQFWRVPKTGTYTIRAAGARGGSATYAGLGIDLTSTFALESGEWLKIVCGQRGEGSTGNVLAGAGGASFAAVFRNGGWVPLLVAGGGAGWSNNSPASTNTNRNAFAPGTRPRETNGGMGSYYSASYATGIGYYWGGGGGGGWTSDGCDGGIAPYMTGQNTGGRALNSTSPLGGIYKIDTSGCMDGGFGGGGATGRDSGAAGGGGGWWGGNATFALVAQTSDDTTQLGGGSYSANATYTNNGTRDGEGFVYVTL